MKGAVYLAHKQNRHSVHEGRQDGSEEEALHVSGAQVNQRDHSEDDHPQNTYAYGKYLEITRNSLLGTEFKLQNLSSIPVKTFLNQ